jgi:hypothetical protein
VQDPLTLVLGVLANLDLLTTRCEDSAAVPNWKLSDLFSLVSTSDYDLDSLAQVCATKELWRDLGNLNSLCGLH